MWQVRCVGDRESLVIHNYQKASSFICVNLWRFSPPLSKSLIPTAGLRLKFASSPPGNWHNQRVFSVLRSLFRFITATCIFLLMANPSIASDPSQALPLRKSPPVIILKLDDLSQKEGTILPAFRKMAEPLEARKIKGSFGLICAVPWPGAQPLQDSGPEYIEWVKKLHASGQIEFWFHGWDHAGHTVDGENCCEFNHRSYEEQKERFDRSQKLALEKLGFGFQTFGPGGGISKYPTYDDNTVKVMGDVPYMKVWLYPKPLDEAGKKLEAQGKVTILDRVMDVNLEKKVGEPDFDWFLKGYSQNPDREYFVLQGHPNTWDDAKFDEVLKIIDFLIEQKAVFMTPSEYAVSKVKR